MPSHEHYVKIGSISGKIMAERQRNQALARYYANPNYCRNCGKLIEVRDGEPPNATRKKKFCNHACAAKYNNLGENYPRFNRGGPGMKAKPRVCKTCGNTYFNSHERRSEMCPPCAEAFQNRVGQRTKAETLRTLIASHAATVMNGTPRVCKCGYDYYVEVCHLKPIKDFPPTALISEINARDNLAYMCPNCHWEHDHPKK